MVEHCIFKRNRVVNKFNRFSKFILIGNNIDGRVNIDIVDFANWEQVIKKLPSILKQLRYEGEWDTRLYQVPDKYYVRHLYGYYRVPSKGKLIFEFGYMQACAKNEVFITNHIIHFSCKTKHSDELRDDPEEGWDFNIYEDYSTIILNDTNNRKKFINYEYPGNMKKLMNNIYERSSC